MVTLRTNSHSPAYSAPPRTERLTAVAAAGGNGDGGEKPPRNIGTGADEQPDRSDEHGDTIYGARAIAAFIFADNDNPQRARRRVYNLAVHYKARNQNAGFFRLMGALCLSKKQWRRFHGLG
ncbi:MAG TPA: hypothetical protein VHY35_05460 [Stellaceae bacterium]|jgi:hypothetical protein|nr:hypothetical protein [Stellaceae bacterium]